MQAAKMPARPSLDQRPGALPKILAEGDSVTFHLDIAGVHAGARLIIRCDPDGTVWAAAEEVPSRRK